MVSLDQLRRAHSASAHSPIEQPPTEYVCQANLNLYDSPAFERLSTQAVAGRQLRILALPEETSHRSEGEAEPAIKIRLCEDGYPGWIPLDDLGHLVEAESPYVPPILSAITIERRIPMVLQYAQRAMQQPNYYLWGGTVGPHYDCSGLVQAAFLAAGIWLPRDAYQQEEFAEAIAPSELRPGNLLFFGQNRTTHVGIYLGNGLYIHSSGKDMGRNGIGIDAITEPEQSGLAESESSAFGDVSRAYRAQFRSAGRVVCSYAPPSLAELKPEVDDAILKSSRQRFSGNSESSSTSESAAPTSEGNS